MLIDFLFELRRHKLNVSTHEWMTLMEAMAMGLHESSLDGFYRLARSICAKDISELDAFDLAFLSYFRGVKQDALALSEELLSWLQDPARFAGLTPEQRAMLEELDIERLRQLFEERLAEQTERHDRGGRWIGTGGRSPFGHGGFHPTGLRVGGPGGRSLGDAGGGRTALSRPIARMWCSMFGRSTWPCAACASSAGREPTTSSTSTAQWTRLAATPASSS